MLLHEPDVVALLLVKRVPQVHVQHLRLRELHIELRDFILQNTYGCEQMKGFLGALLFLWLISLNIMSGDEASIRDLQLGFLLYLEHIQCSFIKLKRFRENTIHGDIIVVQRLSNHGD